MLNRPLIYTLCVAAFCLAWCSQAQARNEARIEVGTGVFCDTQRQVERFVAVFDGDSRAAVDAVNAEENDPTACVFGTVAFIRGPEISTARSRSGAFNIMRVIVVGFLTEAGLRATGPAASFSFEQIDERAA